MAWSWSDDDSSETIFVRFLADLERGEDAAAALRRYEQEFPLLADHLRAMVATRKIIALTATADPAFAPRRPERLGDFRIVRELGSGGMGIVYEAEQRPFGRRVAVKTIKRGRLLIDPAIQQRFLREQKVLARLHHTHIVPIHAAGEEGGLQYYAMPFIQGVSLDLIIRSLRSSGGGSTLPSVPSLAALADTLSSGMHSAPESAATTVVVTEPPEGVSTGPPATLPRPSDVYLRSVARVMMAAAGAIEHANQAEIIHRDVKPSNIMVDRAEHCWVVDFGLAEMRDGALPGTARDGPTASDGRLTVGHVGTRLYMAPEQFEGRADARTDVWGLGVTLYELLTLRRAFNSKDEAREVEPHRPQSLFPEIPPDLDAICWKAIRKDADQRYPTAGALADDLRHWLAGEPPTARPARPIRRLTLWARRNRGWATAAGMSVLALVALAVAGWAAASAAQARAKTAQQSELQAEEREAAQRRESLIQQIQRVRLTPHSVGWSGDIESQSREAARSARDDRQRLQSQVAATLSGFDGQKVKTFSWRASAVASPPHAKRGSLLVAALDGKLHAYDESRDQTRTTPIGQGRYAGLGPFAFRPDGTSLLLAVAHDGSAVELLDADAGKSLRTFRPPLKEREAVTAQSVSAEGTGVAVAVRPMDERGMPLGDQGTLYVWDAGSDRIRFQSPLAGPTDVALSPGGRLLAAGDERGRIALWDLETGERLDVLSASRDTTTSVNCLVFQADPWRAREPRGAGTGWLLAAGYESGLVIVWDLADRVPRCYYRGTEHAIYAVAFSPDGSLLATCGRSQVRIWDSATGRFLLNLPGGNYLMGLAFSQDGTRLATVKRAAFTHPDGVDLWELNDGRGIRSLRGLTTRLSRVVFSGDGRRIAALADNWEVGVWERDDGRLVRLLQATPGRFPENAALAFSPDGRRLAFCSGKEASVWNLDNGTRERTWPLPEGLSDRIAFRSPNELWLFRVETKDGQVGPFAQFDPERYPRVCVIRDLLGPDGTRPKAVIEEFNLYVNTSAIAPDGRFFAVEGLRGTKAQPLRSIRVYDGLTGRQILSLLSQQPPDDVGHGLIFDATGQILAARLIRGGSYTLLSLPSGDERGSVPASTVLLGAKAERWISGRNGSSTLPTVVELHEQGTEPALVEFMMDESEGPAALSPDGRYLITSLAEGTLRVYDLVQIQRRLAGLGLGW